MDIMLPCKFSLPFFHLSFVNYWEKVCFQRIQTQKLIHRRRQASFLSLSVLQGRKSQTGQFTWVRFRETRSCNSPVFIHYQKERWGFRKIHKGGGELDKGVQEMKFGQGRDWRAPLWVRDSEADLKYSCESVLIIVLLLCTLLCSSAGQRLWGGVSPKPASVCP